jgi:hypothetical protein
LLDDARFLFARLFTRNDKWLRQESLEKYEDVSNVKNACTELKERCFLVTESTCQESLEYMLNLLSLNEVKNLAKKHGLLLSKQNKESLISNLLVKCRKQRTIFGSMKDVMLRDSMNVLKPLVRVNPFARETVNLCLTLYLCPTGWEEISLLNDILTISDKKKYFNYIIRPVRLFETRQDLLECMHLNHNIYYCS